MHNKGTELRPIVSTINLDTKHLATVTPLVGKTTFHIENFMDFANKVQHLKLAPEETLIFVLCHFIFPFIPTSEAVKNVRKQLQKDNDLNNRTNFPRDQIFQLFISSALPDFHRQKQGLCHGIPCVNCGQSLHGGTKRRAKESPELL